MYHAAMPNYNVLFVLSVVGLVGASIVRIATWLRNKCAIASCTLLVRGVYFYDGPVLQHHTLLYDALWRARKILTDRQ